MTLQVIFMDAGQGDATLIQYPDGSLVLVDCGCLKNSNVVKGEIKAVLDRYLVSSGNTLRALVLTHPDGDHYNLVNELLVEEDVKINKIFIGGRPEDYGNLSGWLKGRATDFEQGHCSATLVKELSMARGATYPAVDVRILSANAGNPNIKGDANPNSIVLLLSYLDVNLFLMGDSTELAENFILNTLDCGPTPAFQRLLDGKRTVLKVGHHGSYTSSCERWIKRIRPELAFISSDTRTFRGVSLPRSGIVDRLLNVGSIYDFAPNAQHHYVQYNDNTGRHEMQPTTQGVFTTLHLLTWPSPDVFQSFGTSWYYTICPNGPIVAPACGWDFVDKAY